MPITDENLLEQKQAYDPDTCPASWRSLCLRQLKVSGQRLGIRGLRHSGMQLLDASRDSWNCVY